MTNFETGDESMLVNILDVDNRVEFDSAKSMKVSVLVNKDCFKSKREI